MVVDVRYMRDKLKALREQIEEAQYRKFGCIVDTTELEQALLKRFIWDLRSSADQIRAEFQELIKSIQASPWRIDSLHVFLGIGCAKVKLVSLLQADVRVKFTELKQSIEQNTERQNLLLVLTEERNRLKALASRNQRIMVSCCTARFMTSICNNNTRYV